MNAISPTLRAAHDANRAAIRPAMDFGVAKPSGCDVCGNTVVVRGYDCWACETAYNTDVRDTGALASAIGRALELQMDAERGA